MERTLRALARALEAQVAVGADIDVAQLTLASPCAAWSVRDVMNHSIGVTLKFAEFATGTTDRPSAPAGDLVGPDHRAALRAAADRAQAAWAAADMTRTCHLAFGSFSAEDAIGINLFDALAHTWDIATPAGVALPVDDDLWAAGLEAARAVIGPNRDLRHYAPEIAVGVGASAREQFLMFLGRSDAPAAR